MNKKLCIYMVTNELYESYIPYFFHFLDRAYPQYSCLVSHKGKLSEDVKYLLRHFNGDYHVVENSFKWYSDNPDMLKTLRWCNYPKEFDLFDYIYVGDIDIWLVKENVSLLEQHLDVLKNYNTCYSNTDKIDPPDQRGHRMTGLHFFKTKEYLEAMRVMMTHYDYRFKEEEFNKERFPEFYNDKLKKMDNQHALWHLIKEAGLKMPDHSFFEYHGLHLGHSRCKGRWEILFKDDGKHKGYFKQIGKNIDDRFWEIYKHTPKNIQEEIELMLTAGVKNVY